VFLKYFQNTEICQHRVDRFMNKRRKLEGHKREGGRRIYILMLVCERA
jgi:hypothetical protein